MKDALNLPATRSWRDIPQNVKPRAMSREGRRRLQLRVLRAVVGAGVLGLIGWGAWEVAAALQTDSKAAPALGKTVPVKNLMLSTDGVLDRAWLARTLALPKNATLMELDLGRLRARLLASGQARTVAIVRNFPSTLSVSLSERSPVARILAPAGEGPPGALLVARDGVAYEGAGYDPAMVNSLPWLDGVKLTHQGDGFAPVEGMGTVADLLARAQLEAEPIYRTWQTVSLARLPSDGEIEVRTRDGLKVVFGTQEDFFRQLAKLDLLLDAAVGKPVQAMREINLSIGGQASVAMGATGAPTDPSAPPPVGGASAPPAGAGGAPDASASFPFKIHLN